MKEKYITPEMQTVRLQTEDILTGSPIGIIEGGSGDLDFFEFPG